MPQTLMAFLGMMILVFFSLQQQRHAVEHQYEMTSVEMEVMGNAVASEMLEGLERVPFDRAVNDGSSLSSLDESDLTRSENFPEGLTCGIDACEDGLEQFNRMVTSVDSFAVNTPGGASAYFTFELDAEVFYVNDTGAPTTARTMTKRVRLILKNDYMAAPIVMEKDFSPK